MPRGDMIVLRRDTLANWAAAEVSGPALAAGERGHITDLNVDVVGDGAKKVAQLTPVGSGTYAPKASDWASGAVYVVGQLVVNAGTLYRCTTAHTAGGSFAGGNFAALGGGGGSTVTVDADGTLVVNGTTVEVGTDAEIAAAIAAAVSTKASLASPALTGVPTAPTATPGTNTTQLATTAFVAASLNVDLGNASGDATGATDAATINAALASGGVVKGKIGQTYLINAPLIVRTGQVLDMTGCTVRLVPGSNCPMIRNYSDVNPLSTTCKVAASADSINFTAETVGDPIMTLGAAGVTIEMPMQMTPGGAAGKFTGIMLGAPAPNKVFALNRPATQTLGDWTTATLYSRDSRIRITGGIWDRQNNSAPGVNSILNHVFTFRHVDGLRIRGVTFLSTDYNAGLYSALITDCTSVDVEDVTYGLNPNSGVWGTGAGYARDGIHFIGPCKDIKVKGIYGYPGDDMVAITTSDFPGIGDNYYGNVTNVVFEDIHPTSAGACAVKLMGGPGQTLSKVAVRNVFGSTSGSGGAIWIGDDNRQATTSNGIYDDIVLENIHTNAGVNRPLVTFQGPNIGRVSIRNASFNQPAGTGPGIFAIGTNITGIGAMATTVQSLEISGLSVGSMGAGQATVFVESGSVVNELILTDWRAPVSGLSKIGGTGTYKALRFGDRRLASSEDVAVIGRWYPATTLATIGSVFATLTQNKLYVSQPRIATRDLSIDQLGISINIVGSTGAVTRLGIYRALNPWSPWEVSLNSNYAALMIDAGTVATDVGTGGKTITLATPLVIPEGTAYCLAMSPQGAATASYQMRSGANSAQPTAWGTDVVGGATPQVMSMTGVTGALPAIFTPSAFEGMNAYSDHGVYFRRSA